MLRNVVQLCLVRSVHLMSNLLTVWLNALDALVHVVTVTELLE